MSKEFKRQDYMRFSRLGKNRKKLQKWRRPRGIDSKMRIKRRHYPASPRIGYRSPRSELGKIQGLKPLLVHNLKELKLVDKNSIVILARIGAKKKLELLKEAEKQGVKIQNVGGFR